MKSEIPRPCRHGGCNNLTTEGYCEKHTADRYKTRKSSAQRGYGYKWRKAREQHLRLYPFCEECKRQGRSAELATDVDHITPHKGDSILFWDPRNWQSLCHSCHSHKTAAEDGGFGRIPSVTRVPPYPQDF